MHRIVPKLGGAGPLLLLILASPLGAQDLNFHGYIRSGVLLNQDLDYAKTRIDPTLVGRLGNEIDSWVEAELVSKTTTDTGVWAQSHVGFTGNSTNMALVNAGTGAANVAAYLSSAWVELGGFTEAPDLGVFVGKRPWREDIHILDFKWRNIDGAGIGFTGALGGKLEAALLTNDTSATTIPWTLDVRYNLLPSLQLEASGAWVKNGHAATSSTATAENGVQGALVYYWDRFYGLPVGWMTVALQGGLGMFGADDSGSPWSALGGLGSYWTQQQSWAARLVTSGTGNFGPVDVAAGLWAEVDSANQKTWSSRAGANVLSDPRITVAGALRPDWKLTKQLGLEAEVGAAYRTGGGYYWDSTTSTSYQRTGLSYKVTAGPVLSLDSSVGARPQLRALVTYSSQDSSLGAVAADGTHTSELKFGIQAETWW